MQTFLEHVVTLLTEEQRYYLFEAPPPPGAQLFHKDIGLPPQAIPPDRGLRLNYGSHAKQAARDDGLTRLPAALPATFQVIEVEMLHGAPTKWVVRMAHPDEQYRDLVLVVQRDGFVRTVWTNDKNDSHKTLKRNIYTHPKNYVA